MDNALAYGTAKRFGDIPEHIHATHDPYLLGGTYEDVFLVGVSHGASIPLGGSR